MRRFSGKHNPSNPRFLEDIRSGRAQRLCQRADFKQSDLGRARFVCSEFCRKDAAFRSHGLDGQVSPFAHLSEGLAYGIHGFIKTLHCVNTPWLRQIGKGAFIRAQCAVAYAFPGLHPDGYEDAGSGWPRVLKRFAAEAWRRADAGELADDELYPSDAQWAGLYDQMHTHTDDETARRFQLAADHGERADG